MTARIFPFREGIGMGNLMWEGSHPMQAGRFPHSHPLAPGWHLTKEAKSQLGDGPLLRAFRDRGYWASCFPEGDGVTWQPMENQDEAQSLHDLREVFSEWTLVEGVPFARQSDASAV